MAASRISYKQLEIRMHRKNTLHQYHLKRTISEGRISCDCGAFRTSSEPFQRGLISLLHMMVQHENVD